MATIYNSDLTNEIIAAAKIATARENFPTQIAEKVVPVMEVNPKLFRRVNVLEVGSITNNTNSNFYTTPTDRDFYLTSAILSVIKDATSTSLATNMNVQLEGKAIQNLIKIPHLTLTAQTAIVSQTYNPPIKLEKGSFISIGMTTNVANCTVNGQITGYTVAP